MQTIPWTENSIEEIVQMLRGGGIAVLPTDTIYGVLAMAVEERAVEKVYKAKGRSPEKPAIILIDRVEDLNLFGIFTTEWQKEQMAKYWPGKVSVIFECDNEKLSYLHRGTKSLAFRLPDDSLLRKLLSITGPLVAPSANPEGDEPALDIDSAKKYFGKRVPLYIDGGIRVSPPSTLISLVGDELKVIRGKL